MSMVPAPSVLPAPDDAERMGRQRALLEGWLQSDQAMTTARRLVRRRGIGQSPEELVSEGWLRLGRVLDARSEPFPDMETEESAARYLARVLDNISRDMLRASVRRREVELAPTLSVDSATSAIENRVLLEQLVVAVGRRAVASDDCPGCARAVVAGTALEIVHLALTGHDGSEHGTTYFDRLLYEALERTAGAGSAAALRQRKARCGRCVSELLAEAMRSMGADPT